VTVPSTDAKGSFVMGQGQPPADTPGALTHERVREICGDITDSQASALLAVGLSEEELEEAVAWASGESDVMGDERRPLSDRVAAAYDILTVNIEPEERRD
jgi:hypothetical protein